MVLFLWKEALDAEGSICEREKQALGQLEAKSSG